MFARPALTAYAGAASPCSVPSEGRQLLHGSRSLPRHLLPFLLHLLKKFSLSTKTFQAEPPSYTGPLSNSSFASVSFPSSHTVILHLFCWRSWGWCSVVLDAEENNVEKNPQQALCPWLQVRALCFDRVESRIHFGVLVINT